MRYLKYSGSFPWNKQVDISVLDTTPDWVRVAKVFNFILLVKNTKLHESDWQNIQFS